MPGNNGSQHLVPSFRVRINGADLPAQAVADLASVTVHQDIEAAGMFTLHLTSWDLNQRQVTWADDQRFAPGKQVEIQMGYVDNLESLMVGEITGLELEHSAQDPLTLTVRGYDRRHRLLRGRKTRSFVKMKDSDIARQIASDSGLRAEVRDTGVTLEYVLQHNQTDMAFLQDRAQRLGYEVMVEDKTLYFRPHQHTHNEVLTLDRDRDLLEFFPRLTTQSQVDTVAVHGWNPKQKATILSQASAGAVAGSMGGSSSGPKATRAAFGQASAISVDRPVFSGAEADQMARGRLNEMALDYISGEGMTLGRTDLRAGTVVKIEGLGERFSGRYYVTATRHTYTPARGYYTTFTVRRNAT
jgi:phage protein D